MLGVTTGVLYEYAIGKSGFVEAITWNWQLHANEINQKKVLGQMMYAIVPTNGSPRTRLFVFIPYIFDNASPPWITTLMACWVEIIVIDCVTDLDARVGVLGQLLKGSI